MLSPGNVPALKTLRPSRFLIATRPDDWAALRETNMFRLLERHVEPVYLEIPPCPPGIHGCQHMGIGHRLACEMAHRDKAYAILLTPDSMLSDGSVARLQELARQGTELVLTPAVRFGEEPFFARLRELGLVPAASGQASAPLAIPARHMVQAAVNGLHSETAAYEWDAPGLMAITPLAWWRVPGEDGLVLHSLSWAPLLLDYAAIGAHDTSTFDQWTFDGDYLFNNSENIKKVHVVQDSDEMFLVSWGPLADRPVRKTRFPFERSLAGYFFQQSFYSSFFDPLKRRLFFLPVRWHSKPLNDKWSAVETRAAREIRRWVRPPAAADSAAAGEAAEPPVARPGPLLWMLKAFAYAWIYRRRIGYHLGQMARGNRATGTRVLGFLRTFVGGAGVRSGGAGK